MVRSGHDRVNAPGVGCSRSRTGVTRDSSAGDLIDRLPGPTPGGLQSGLRHRVAAGGRRRISNHRGAPGSLTGVPQPTPASGRHHRRNRPDRVDPTPGPPVRLGGWAVPHRGATRHRPAAPPPPHPVGGTPAAVGGHGQLPAGTGTCRCRHGRRSTGQPQPDPPTRPRQLDLAGSGHRAQQRARFGPGSAASRPRIPPAGCTRSPPPCGRRRFTARRPGGWDVHRLLSRPAGGPSHCGTVPCPGGPRGTVAARSGWHGPAAAPGHPQRRPGPPAPTTAPRPTASQGPVRRDTGIRAVTRSAASWWTPTWRSRDIDVKYPYACPGVQRWSPATMATACSSTPRGPGADPSAWTAPSTPPPHGTYPNPPSVTRSAPGTRSAEAQLSHGGGVIAAVHPGPTTARSGSTAESGTRNRQPAGNSRSPQPLTRSTATTPAGRCRRVRWPPDRSLPPAGPRNPDRAAHPAHAGPL